MDLKQLQDEQARLISLRDQHKKNHDEATAAAEKHKQMYLQVCGAIEYNGGLMQAEAKALSVAEAEKKSKEALSKTVTEGPKMPPTAPEAPASKAKKQTRKPNP